MFRYFIRYSDDTPVALIRLSIDTATQTIIDQYWHATLTHWKDGHYGMDVLIKGNTNTVESTKPEAQRLFPNASWE
jgi:hypothetical protein